MKTITKKAACEETRRRVTGPHPKGFGRWTLAVNGESVASEGGTFFEMQTRLRLRRIDMARVILGHPSIFDGAIETGDFVGGRWEAWV